MTQRVNEQAGDQTCRQTQNQTGGRVATERETNRTPNVWTNKRKSKHVDKPRPQNVSEARDNETQTKETSCKHTDDPTGGRVLAE